MNIHDLFDAFRPDPDEPRIMTWVCWIGLTMAFWSAIVLALS